MSPEFAFIVRGNLPENQVRALGMAVRLFKGVESVGPYQETSAGTSQIIDGVPTITRIDNTAIAAARMETAGHRLDDGVLLSELSLAKTNDKIFLHPDWAEAARILSRTQRIMVTRIINCLVCETSHGEGDEVVTEIRGFEKLEEIRDLLRQGIDLGDYSAVLHASGKEILGIKEISAQFVKQVFG